MHALVLTLACWHGATPGAVAGAGSDHSLVLSHHHVARLAHECHVLAHRGLIPDPQTIGWDAGVTAGDHCGWKSGNNKMASGDRLGGVKMEVRWTRTCNTK